MFESFTLAAAVSNLDALDPIPDAADVIEFRMDMATEPLVQLDRYAGEIPIIATNRSRWEGGNALDHRRLATLQAAIERPVVRAIDVELASIEAGDADEVLETARSADVAVIASWHDFDGTPGEDALRERLESAIAVGDVGKAAVMASEPTDVLPLLRVTAALSADGEAVATMSMGKAGRHSRVIAPIYGSRIGYAPPTRSAATAPGQYDLQTLADLIDALG